LVQTVTQSLRADLGKKGVTVFSVFPGAVDTDMIKAVEMRRDDRRPDLVAVIRFPTAEAIRGFLASPEYRASLPHSDQAFSEVHSYIAADLMD